MTLTPEKDWKTIFLAHLAESGNVKASCRKAGVSRQTAYLHRAQDDEFAQAWEHALTVATSLLEDEAWRRAVRGVSEPVYFKGDKVGSVRRYSDTLLIFLLKAHNPQKYRERLDINANIQGVTHIKVEYVDQLPDDDGDDPA